MLAIKTRFLPATDHRGSRIQASSMSFPRKTYDYHALEGGDIFHDGDKHITAARQYANEMQLDGRRMASGQLSNEVWVHCFVYN